MWNSSPPTVTRVTNLSTFQKLHHHDVTCVVYFCTAFRYCMCVYMCVALQSSTENQCAICFMLVEYIVLVKL